MSCSWGVKRILDDGQKVTGLEFVCCSSVFDKDGKFNPAFDETRRTSMPADKVIMAIGLTPNTSAFSKEIELNRNGTIKANAETLQTSIPNVFAGGDAVTGPSMIVKSIGQGKRAAFYIDRYLQGLGLDSVRFDERPEMVDRDTIVEQSRNSITPRNPVKLEKKPIGERLNSFIEL